jgi:hypothetical protein
MSGTRVTAARPRFEFRPTGSTHYTVLTFEISKFKQVQAGTESTTTPR